MQLGLGPKCPASLAIVRPAIPPSIHPPRTRLCPPFPQAAARHQCSYLVGSHMAEFLQTGGDPEWLLGLHRAPKKLRKLSEINKLLAHRPWLITKEHIQVLRAERHREHGGRAGACQAVSPGPGIEQVGPSFLSRPC